MFIRPGVELANLSDTGRVRSDNQDYYCYAEPADDGDFERKGRLAVVADGMGGHAGGQVASGVAVDRVRQIYLAHPGDDPREALVAAFQEAHAAIQEQAREDPELRGMGTTCTAAVMRGNELYYAHVGDSRMYLIHDGVIHQLTEDHNYVGRLLREGRITPEEAAVHPDRNILTAALGMESAVPVEISDVPLEIASGDVVLICTDGLHGLVGDPELLEAATRLTPHEACRELVQRAKDRGGSDNITLEILRKTGDREL